jgi:hypothetical protein
MKKYLLTSGLIGVLLAFSACTSAPATTTEDVTDDAYDDAETYTTAEDLDAFALNELIEGGGKTITTASFETTVENSGKTVLFTGVVAFSGEDAEFDVVQEGKYSFSEHVIQVGEYLYTQNGEGTFTRQSGLSLNAQIYGADLPEAAHDALFDMIGSDSAIRPVVTLVGEEQLDGQPVKHYNATGKQALASNPEASLDIWFNAAGQPIKYVYAEQDTKTTSAYTNIGEPVTIEAPTDFIE